MKRALYLCLLAVAVASWGCSAEQPTASSADPTAAADPTASSADAAAAAEADRDPPAHVYTNEDLDRLPSETELPPDDGSPGVVVLAPAEPKPPLRIAAADTSGPVESAEQRVAAASSRVVVLEQRLSAIRNPFLPRPELPPDEGQAWEGLDGAQRAARVEQQLVVARSELHAAEDELMSLRADARTR